MTVDLLTLKALSPIALHRRRTSEQFAPTLDYLPGGTVRGALADAYLQGDPSRAEETLFRQIFLSDVVRFSDFLPAGKFDLARILPATAVACKRFEDHVDSRSDALLRLELLREWDSPDLAKHNAWKECPNCEAAGLKGKRDRAEAGYYAPDDPATPIKVRRRMIAGAAIERATGTAAHSMLFSHDVIEESGAYDKQETLFRGAVLVPETLRQEIKDLASKNPRLAVGYGRSRGWGQLEVQGWESPRSEAYSLKERWSALNDTIRQLWQQHGRVVPGQYFSLTLQSHLILKDEQTGQPVLDDIQAVHLGLPAGIEWGYCAMSAVVVSGWNMAAELPKADDWALGRGSVLLWRIPHDVDPEPILKRLEEIEVNGLGERRNEGFGRMTACEPYHYIFTQRELSQGGSR